MMANQPPWTAKWLAFEQSILDAWPLSRWAGLGVVVGCSGGADSVSLLRALCEIRNRQPARAATGFVVAAHFNHALRGEQSDGDEQFVCDLADQLGIRAIVDRNREPIVTDENSLRKRRLSFLRQVAEGIGARYVALGHTADDNIETVLHHLFRGTGTAGLSGIASHRPLGDDLVLVRPMLGIPRDQIRDLLTAVGQPWREDSSNLDPSYRRNWLRHELIPQIRSKYPRAEAAIRRATEIHRQSHSVIQSLAHDWLSDQMLQADPPQIRRCAPSDNSKAPDPAIVIAAMQQFWDDHRWPRSAMSTEHWLRIYRSLTGISIERYHLPGGVQVDAGDSCVAFSLLPLQRKDGTKPETSKQKPGTSGETGA